MEARGVYDGYYRVGDRIEFRYSDLSPTGKSAVIKQIGTADARNVIFRNNTFADQTERKIPFPRRSGFFVENADSVSIVDNCYIASPLVPFPGVWSDGRSVTRLVAEGNRSVSGDKL